MKTPRPLLAMLKRVPAATAVIAVGAALALSPVAEAANKSKLGTYEHGKPATGLSCDKPLATQSAVLMGGGKDVEAAFTWMIEQSRKCPDGRSPRPGNFLVLRVAGNPAYDSFIAKLGELAAVQTVVVPDRETADSPELDSYVQNASAIFLTGGDQGEYYAQWRETRLMRLVQAQIATWHTPVGGTSAGMMMLSEYNYVAIPYGVTSAAALANPYLIDYTTIKNDFWVSASSPASQPMRAPIAGLQNFITDSHFTPRDRMGRLVTFLARIMAADAGDYYPGAPVAAKDARAIGVDAQTALLLEYADSRGNKSFTGATITNPDVDGHAYVLFPTQPPACSDTQPLTIACGSQPGQFDFPPIDVFRLGRGSTFDFNAPNRNSTGAVQWYRVDVRDNALTGNSDGLYGLY